MGSDTDALHNLAAAIADGSKVDWDHVEGALSPEEQRLLKQLRLIAKIAGAQGASGTAKLTEVPSAAVAERAKACADSARTAASDHDSRPGMARIGEAQIQILR